MGNFALANELAILVAGANAAWVEQTSYTGAPTTAGVGVYLDGAIRSLVAVSLRESVHHRTARVTVTAVDTSATYTITIDGHAASYAAVGGDLAADIVQGLADALNASGTITAIITASAEDTDDDAAVDTVLIVGATGVETDWTLAVAATGTGSLAATADAATASMRIYSTMRGSSAPEGWREFLAPVAIDYRGGEGAFDTASRDRLYVELASVAGPGGETGVTYTASVYVGPSIAP